MFFMVVVTILNNNSIQKVSGSCHLMWNPTESLSTITFISEHCFLAASRFTFNWGVGERCRTSELEKWILAAYVITAITHLKWNSSSKCLGMIKHSAVMHMTQVQMHSWEIPFLPNSKSCRTLYNLKLC